MLVWNIEILRKEYMKKFLGIKSCAGEEHLFDLKE
jgi:hypothetical protein